MKTLIIYDSVWGNTEKIARAVGDALPGEIIIARVTEVDQASLKSSDLIIIGSPTQGGRPLKSISGFLSGIPDCGLRDMPVAAFDTRTKVGGFALILVNMLGYAANRIAKILKAKGGKLVIAPVGFLVTGKEGPIIEGEIKRAVIWAKELSGKV